MAIEESENYVLDQMPIRITTKVLPSLSLTFPEIFSQIRFNVLCNPVLTTDK